MGTLGPKTREAWERENVVLSGGATPTRDGGVELPRKNRWPDPSDVECPLPDEAVAYHVHESEPGKRIAATATAEEKKPPKRETMTRQTTAPVGLAETWEASQPRIDGFSPYSSDDPHAAAASLAPLDAPEVEVLQVERGFAGGPTGALYALKRHYGWTTPSPMARFDLSSGEGFRFYLPEGVRGVAGSSAALKIALYMPRPGSVDPATAKRQGVWDLSELLDDHIDVPGPYNDDGPRPEKRNQSGVGRPKGPAKNREPDDPYRPWVRLEPGRFDLQAGRYEVLDLVREGGAMSLASEGAAVFEIEGDEEERERRLGENEEPGAGETLRERGGERFAVKTVRLPYKKKKALVFHVPENPRPRSEAVGGAVGERERAHRAHVPIVVKDGVPHRAYRKSRGYTPSEAYEVGAKVEIYGYPPDAEPKGLKDGLYQQDTPDPNDPEADGTALPAPTEPPDEPTPIGLSIERGQPCDVLVAASGVTADGAEGPRSPAVRKRLAALETYRVRVPSPVGKLRNAQFSARGPSGRPRHHDLRNLPAGRWKAEEGALTMLQPVTIGGDFPQDWTEPVPITPETMAVFVGAVQVLRRIQGAAELVVEELSEAGAVLRTTTALRIASGRSRPGNPLGHHGFRMGARTTTPWHPDATHFRYVPRLGMGADTGCNLDAVFSDIEVFLHPAVRKVLDLSDGTADFDPPASTPYPRESLFARGPAPIPAGGATEAPAPLSLVTFEDGTFNATNAAAWTQETQGGATANVTAAAAIHGAFGIEVAAPSSNNPSYNRRRFDAGAGRSSLAIREPVRANLRPTRGEATHHRVLDSQDRVIARLTHASGGVWRLEVVGPNGNVLRRLSVTYEDGEALDLELSVSGGGTRSGAVRVGASRFGEPREILAEETGIDLTGRNPRYAYAQVSFQSDPQGRYRYHIDQVVVTPGGDVLDREAPALPAGEAPATPDAPNYMAPPYNRRLYDKEGFRLVQDYLFLRAGTSQGEYGPRTRRPIAVRPGDPFTVAVFGRHALFDPVAGQYRPARPYTVVLSGPGKEPLDLGSPYERTEGTRPRGEADWQEYWRTYAVPPRTGPDDPGYLWCDLVSLEMPAGVYVWQEGLWAKGHLATPAERDAARTRARETNGSVSVVIDTRPPSTVHTPGVQARQRWASEAGTPAAVGEGLVNPLWASGPTKDGPWQESAAPALLPENDFARFTAGLAGDGSPDAEAGIAAGGISLRTVSEIALLQKENGEDLPGLGVIGELLPDYTRGNYAIKEINGRPFAAKTSDDVRKLPGFAVSVYTEEATRFLLKLTPNDRVRIADPHVNGGEGLDFLVRCADLLEITDKEAPTEIKDGVRRVFASFAVPWAYVEEAAPLPGPRPTRSG